MDVLKTIWRSIVVLLCSAIQVVEAVLTGIGMMFCGAGNGLKVASSWLMKKLVRGKYENALQVAAN